MFCRNCGKQTTDGSKFCSFCGAPLTEPAPQTSATNEFESKVEQKKPVFETFDWNVNDYPNSTRTVAKTEDINFDWGADPNDIKDRYTRGLSGSEKADIKVQSEIADGLNIEDFIPSKPRHAEPEQDISAAEKIDKFYTFSKKNEDFQKLLNKEYEKISGGNPIQQEKSIAEQVAEKRFENRMEDPSMEEFLKREGIEKPYEPKAFDSEVLRKIEAQERAREEARLEAEARQKALEEARLKAEAEKRAAEEARLKIEEEARRAQEEAIRAENEARIALEQEKRIRAEAEARVRAEEERARLKAEAEIRAQQEAAKIKAQHAARQAVAEEERYRAEVERRQQEEARLREQLYQTQANLQKQANNAVANETVKSALNQTARMKEEEAAKIRAAVASLKGEPAPKYTPTPEHTPEPETATPVNPIPATDPILAAASQATSVDANRMAHQATQDTLSEMARARQAFLQNYGNEEVAPAIVDEMPGDKPVTGRNTMRSESTDMSATRTVDKNAVLAGMEATRRISKEELRAVETIEAEQFEAPSIERKDESIATVEDLLNQFMPGEEQPTEDATKVDDVVEGFVAKEEPTVEPEVSATEEEKPGLDNTMVIANEGFEEGVQGSFDEYGEKEANELKRRQETEMDAAPVIQTDKSTSRRANAEDDDFDGEKKSGAGRIVLKVLLIILIVIFAAELAGIGIKFLAPNSKAADVIDNQLNKVIHLITGSEINYDVPGIEYKV